MIPDAPVVLVPGMLCDADLWAGPAVPGSLSVSITEPSITGMADQVLAALEGPFVLVGLSLGAIVGFEVLRRAPERVAGFCAMSTNADAPRPEQRAGWQDMRARTAADDFDGVVHDLAPTMFATPEPPREHAERFAAMAQRVGPVTFTAQLAAQATRIDARPGLRAASCPVLAVCGDQDALCPVGFHQAIADAAPNARLHVVPGAGHLLPIERPHDVAALLRDWLRAPSTP